MSPRASIPHRTLVAASVIFVVLAASAGAYWNSGGSGSAQTQVGNRQQLVVNPGTPSEELYPGSAAGVALVVSNPNPYPAHFATLTLNTEGGTGGFTVDGGHAACGVSGLSFVTQNNAGAGWTVPPRSGSDDGILPINLPGSISMNSDVADTCQGAAFTVHLIASGA